MLGRTCETGCWCREFSDFGLLREPLLRRENLLVVGIWNERTVAEVTLNCKVGYREVVFGSSGVSTRNFTSDSICSTLRMPPFSVANAGIKVSSIPSVMCSRQ